MTIEDTYPEKLLCADLSLLLGNALHRTGSNRTAGFHVPFNQFKDLCDGDARLARRVLLRTGWIPDDGDIWIWGKGRNALEKAIPLDVLEEAYVAIFDDYRPLDDEAARPVAEVA